MRERGSDGFGIGSSLPSFGEATVVLTEKTGTQ